MTIRNAFDASESQGGTWATSVSSLTWTHNVSGNEPVIFVSMGLYNSSARTVTGITCGGTAMTKLDSITSSLESQTQDFEIWYLKGPAAGSNSIVATLSASTSFVQGQSLVAYGIDQTSPIDSHAIGQSLTSVADFAQATTVVSSSAVLIGFIWGRVSPLISANSGSDMLLQSTTSFASGYKTAGIVGTGSQSVSFHLGTSGAVPGAAAISLLTSSGWTADTAGTPSSTIALVSHVSAQGGTSVTTGSINTSGANFLVAVLTDFNQDAASVISDNKSNAWLILPYFIGAGSAGRTRIAFCRNPTVGTGHTFTLSNSGRFSGIAVAAFSGVVSDKNPFDQMNGAITAGSTSLACGSITPLLDKELIVYGICDAWTGTVSVSTGTILEQLPLIGGSSFGVALAYTIQTTAAAINPTWTTSNTHEEAVIASFMAGESFPSGTLQSAVSIM
jgi:hypothetical protein